MKQLRTQAIILRRTNYGEADRILNFLTPDHGKLSAIAKGIRKPKSKLAGGLELFATCDINVLQRAGNDFGLVTSSRLVTFYGNILKDYDRMQPAYELVAQINRVTETVTEPDFYYLLRDGLGYLHELTIDARLVELWFRLQLANLLGVGLNLRRTVDDQPLEADGQYNFDITSMAFVPHHHGRYSAEHIKLLRLAHAKNPAILRQVSGVGEYIEECLQLVRAL